MSELPAEALREFAELYKQEYGVELSPEETAFRARNFLNLYAAVLLDGSDSAGELTRPTRPNERSP